MSSTPEDDTGGDITKRLIADLLVRLRYGESGAGFDLARALLGTLPLDDAETALAVVEALVTQSAQLGSSDARQYLEERWPKMREASVKRLRRRGLK